MCIKGRCSPHALVAHHWEAMLRVEILHCASAALQGVYALFASESEVYLCTDTTYSWLSRCAVTPSGISHDAYIDELTVVVSCLVVRLPVHTCVAVQEVGQQRARREAPARLRASPPGGSLLALNSTSWSSVCARTPAIKQTLRSLRAIDGAGLDGGRCEAGGHRQCGCTAAGHAPGALCARHRAEPYSSEYSR